jgi:hypothetical protein
LSGHWSGAEDALASPILGWRVFSELRTIDEAGYFDQVAACLRVFETTARQELDELIREAFEDAAVTVQ